MSSRTCGSSSTIKMVLEGDSDGLVSEVGIAGSYIKVIQDYVLQYTQFSTPALVKFWRGKSGQSQPVGLPGRVMRQRSICVIGKEAPGLREEGRNVASRMQAQRGGGGIGREKLGL